VFLAGCAGAQGQRELWDRTAEALFECTIVEGAQSRTANCRYLLVFPKQYGQDQRKWPMIMFLHGAGKRPDDFKKMWIPVPPQMDGLEEDFPFIVVYPQCPRDSEGQYKKWPNELLIALLDDIEGRCRVDKERIYLTGLSMGGTATWSLACAYPDRFAAIAPVCGRTRPSQACRLRDVGVWAFHGAKDSFVPLRESEDMFRAVRACGGKARLTIYTEAGHDAWTPTYKNKELYDWFLRHVQSGR
jgi:predicted peptidase